MTLISMLAGYGRGRFGKQNAAMLRRTYYYSMEERNNRT